VSRPRQSAKFSPDRPIGHGGYDATDDVAKSLEEAYRAIRERMSRGGPGWAPKRADDSIPDSKPPRLAERRHDCEDERE
jgi:hypothetical protein